MKFHMTKVIDLCFSENSKNCFILEPQLVIFQTLVAINIPEYVLNSKNKTEK